ncbi:MAG: T9SS type A sorting domain-containing protein [Candidatus Kapabacteria bacterium]|nr:T9SS type A sorting domain-containing protein [Candidatus Kapabacteria bacterium]
MMKKLILIIVLLLSWESTLTAEWKMIDSLNYPTENSKLSTWFKAIDCYDNQNCIAFLWVGDQSIRTRSTSDGGETWHSFLRDTIIKKYHEEDDDYDIIYRPARPFNIHYQSKNLCIALCDSGYYWRSTDSCHTWKKHKIDTEKSLINIDFYDDNIGIMSTYYKMYKTLDGGLTWDSVDVNCETPPTGYHEVKIPDENSIIILGYHIDIGDYIIRSDDNCESWKNYDAITPRVRDIHFFNDVEGFAIGKEQIKPKSSSYRDIIQETSDGGKTWEVRLDTFSSPQKGLMTVEFADRQHGIAMGTFWRLWKTNDGGKTWENDSTNNYPNTNDDFWDISYPSPDTVYGVTSNSGKIYMKTDYTVGVEPEPERTYTSVSLYPNPARPGEAITIAIDSEKPESCSASVYSVDGRQISDSFNFDLRPGQNGIQYKADRDLNPGAYFVLIEKDCGVISVRFVVVE